MFRGRRGAGEADLRSGRCVLLRVPSQQRRQTHRLHNLGRSTHPEEVSCIVCVCVFRELARRMTSSDGNAWRASCSLSPLCERNRRCVPAHVFTATCAMSNQTDNVWIRLCEGRCVLVAGGFRPPQRSHGVTAFPRRRSRRLIPLVETRMTFTKTLSAFYTRRYSYKSVETAFNPPPPQLFVSLGSRCGDVK